MIQIKTDVDSARLELKKVGGVLRRVINKESVV